MSLWLLLRTLTLPEWRAHPLRQALALLAVALGVALAFSVHLINQSALAEFSAAVRAANGEPDAALVCARREGCDDALIDALASNAAVSLASPVVEVDSYAIGRNGQRIALKLVGIDALQVAAVAPALLPRAADTANRLAALDPDAVFLNASAQQRLGVQAGDTLPVQHGLATVALRVAGQVAAGGAALAVIDIAGAQAHFGLEGRLTRIDLRLAAGAPRRIVLAAGLPAGWSLAGRRRRRPARGQRVACLPRQPDGAGPGGLVRRRLPGLLGTGPGGGAAHARAGAARRARPVGR